jgi:N-carbamoyl-L-amino-acid hydrolase
MMFVQSLHGISHNKIEDTKEEHLEMCVTAFDKLAEKTMGWIKGRLPGNLYANEVLSKV